MWIAEEIFGEQFWTSLLIRGSTNQIYPLRLPFDLSKECLLKRFDLKLEKRWKLKFYGDSINFTVKKMKRQRKGIELKSSDSKILNNPNCLLSKKFWGCCDEKDPMIRQVCFVTVPLPQQHPKNGQNDSHLDQGLVLSISFILIQPNDSRQRL